MDGTNYSISIMKDENRYSDCKKVIIYKAPLTRFAKFNGVDQFERFQKRFGFTYSIIESKPNGDKFFVINERFIDDFAGLIWKLDQLPEGAKPFKALSNGEVVTCYFTKDEDTIRIYRPNPNGIGRAHV